MKMLRFLKITAGAVVTGALLLSAANATAQQITPRIYDLGTYKVTNSAANVTVSSTITQNTNLFEAMAGTHDMALLITAVSNTNNTGGLGVGFNLALDGTTFTTTTPLNYSTTLNGTNSVIYGVVIPKTSFDGFKSIQWSTVTVTNNATGAGTNLSASITTVDLKLGVVP